MARAILRAVGFPISDIPAKNVFQVRRFRPSWMTTWAFPAYSGLHDIV